MNKFFKIFITIFLCCCSFAFADVKSTRKALSHYCTNNPKTLKKYDQITKSWTAYEKQKNGEWDLEKLLKAVEYAAEKHETQIRKDAQKTPYIIHPIGVTQLLWDIGNIHDIDILAAGLLHDTLEDTDASEAEIQALFGKRVLSIVKEVTNDPNLSGEENKQRQIDHAPTMSIEGKLVKLADRLYNVKDLENPPPSWSDDKIDQYYNWGKKLLVALKDTNQALEIALDHLLQSKWQLEKNIQATKTQQKQPADQKSTESTPSPSNKQTEKTIEECIESGLDLEDWPENIQFLYLNGFLYANQNGSDEYEWGISSGWTRLKFGGVLDSPTSWHISAALAKKVMEDTRREIEEHHK